MTRLPIPSRTSYWRAVTLAGLVLLGWAWDGALGGGRSDALGWLAAVAVVGGIAALAVHGARLAEQLPDGPPTAAAGVTGPAAAQAGPATAAATGTDRQIRLAEPADLAPLPALERSADTLFTVAGYGDVGEPAPAAELAAAAAVLVAGRPPIGFARIEIVDGQAHLQGLSVALRCMKQGVGGALIEAACDWALAAGFERMTLTTFADVAWNGPLFTRRGFTEVTEFGPELAELWRAEQRLGLAAVGGRVVLARRL